MRRVRFLTEAENELKSAAGYYESIHRGLGEAFAREVQLCVRRIREMPAASKIERADIRVRSVGRFPYRIYYRFSDTEIVLIAVGHRRLRSGFWSSRL